MTQAYNIEASSGAKKKEGSAKKLVYGSAELEGYFYNDKICPVKSECFLLEFLAIYKAKGIHKDTDGIIGLSPIKGQDNNGSTNILLQMKHKKMIDKAAISFSLSLDGGAFALFGGVDPKQIVGGHKALVYFDNHANSLGTWALEGQGIYYGKTPYPLENKVAAIIDTGTSQIALPSKLFQDLKNEWTKQLGNEVVCSEKDVFCHVPKDCN